MIPQESKLLPLLSGNDVTFFIPPYQRNYEWTEDQCRVFFDDVLKTYEKNASGILSEHFFGTITYFQTEAVFGQPNTLVLIDGQQRITTTMLFLVAVRDIYEKQGIGAFIDAKYLKNSSISEDYEYKIKLKQVESDWPVYCNIVMSYELSETEKASTIYHNYKYFLNKLNGLKVSGYDLTSLIEKGLDKFSVITIQLQPQKNPWENPQEIFESMNSLGKPLSLADLVRNYLLLGLDADTQTELYKKYWLYIEKTIPGHVSDFIRDYMQMQTNRAFSKATDAHYKYLYSQFKLIFAETDAQTLLKEFFEYASLYACIIEGKPSGSIEIDLVLKDLRVFSVTTAYSFLLSLLKSWKDGQLTKFDVYDILDVFKIYLLRRRIVSLVQAENKVFPALSARIQDLCDANSKRRKMFELLANLENALRLPNDIEIKRYLETVNFYNFRYCKFYLSLVEEKLTKSRPNLSDDLLQIEHILPQSLNEAWKRVLGDNWFLQHQELVNTIGNLTLIRHNKELGNRVFSEKKQIYEDKAGLQIAKTEIINKTIWNSESIVQRTAWITSIMLNEVMPIPDDMRQSNNFAQRDRKRLSFDELHLIGETITFLGNPSITALVIDDQNVEFEGKTWKLSPLTKEIQKRLGKTNATSVYAGSQYWEFNGFRLNELR